MLKTKQQPKAKKKLAPNHDLARQVLAAVEAGGMLGATAAEVQARLAGVPGNFSACLSRLKKSGRLRIAGVRQTGGQVYALAGAAAPPPALPVIPAPDMTPGPAAPVAPPVLAAPPTPAKKQRTHVVIVCDQSGSMANHREGALALVNGQLAELRKLRPDQEHEISLFFFSGDRHETQAKKVREQYFNFPPALVPELKHYDAIGNTPLCDAIVVAGRRAMCADTDTEKCFLVLVVTDGEENNSATTWGEVVAFLKDRQATDRWTFAFMVPPGWKDRFVRESQGQVFAGNVTEWADAKKAAVEATVGTQAYLEQRSRGVRSSKTFFAPNARSIDANVLARLTKITSEVRVLEVKESGKQQIEPWINVKTGGKFRPGRAFFELVKREDEIQSYKKLLLRDRTTKEVYADGPGLTVRAALGLPDHTIPVEPGDHANFAIFVQSTSTNRILPYGTSMIFYEAAVV